MLLPVSAPNTPSAPAACDVGIGWRQPHYASLLQTPRAIDFLEVHSENFFAAGGAALAVLERGRAHYPISLHGVGLALGSAAGVDDWHLQQLAQLVRRVDPVRVSDHASFARARVDGNTIHASDLLPIPFNRQALDVLCNNVQRVQDRLQRPIAVENLSAYIQWQTTAEDALAEPFFLMELTRRSGCALLIDVNNIFVNARNADLKAPLDVAVARCRTWLDQIDGAAVAEIHLAGHCYQNDVHGEIVIDDHSDRVCPEVWQLYRHALQRLGPVPTLIEWDTAIPELDVLLDEAARARACALERA